MSCKTQGTVQASMYTASAREYKVYELRCHKFKDDDSQNFGEGYVCMYLHIVTRVLYVSITYLNLIEAGSNHFLLRR